MVKNPWHLMLPQCGQAKPFPVSIRPSLPQIGQSRRIMLRADSMETSAVAAIESIQPNINNNAKVREINGMPNIAIKQP